MLAGLGYALTMENLQKEWMPTKAGRLWTLEAGTGPVVVFLHGILSESTAWYPIAEALRDRYRVIMIDGPGHGQSDAALPGVTLEAYADAIGEVLVAKGVQEAVFVGLSLGGMVAQRIALRAPERVRGLVLMGTTCDGPSFLVRLRFRITGEFVRHFGMAKPFRLSLRRLVFPKAFIDANPEAMALLAERYKTWDARKTRHVFGGLFSIQGVRDQLAAVTAPTLVMVGELDRVAPPEFSRHIAEAIPGAKLLVMPTIGHVIPMEAASAFQAQVEGFLGEVYAAPSRV